MLDKADGQCRETFLFLSSLFSTLVFSSCLLFPAGVIVLHKAGGQCRETFLSLSSLFSTRLYSSFLFFPAGVIVLDQAGGQCREVMDCMHKPRNFPRVFTCSYLYVFTLTLPSAATMFAAFPSQAALHGKPTHCMHLSCPSRAPPPPPPPQNTPSRLPAPLCLSPLPHLPPPAVVLLLSAAAFHDIKPEGRHVPMTLYQRPPPHTPPSNSCTPWVPPSL